MIYKLLNTQGLTREQITEKVNSGYTFRIFRYQVALVAVTFFRLSPAILIKDESEMRECISKYNARSWFFGLWFFPTGPLNVIRTVRLNNKGGVDVTKDILLNLENYNLQEGIVDMKMAYTLFDKMDDRTDYKELCKSINAFRTENPAVKNFYAGRYINVNEHEETPNIIAIDFNGNKEKMEEELKAHLYKRFHKFVKFTFLYKHENPELFERIMEQGEKVD